MNLTPADDFFGDCVIKSSFNIELFIIKRKIWNQSEHPHAVRLTEHTEINVGHNHDK